MEKQFSKSTIGIFIYSIMPFGINIITFFFLDVFGIFDNLTKILMKPIYIPYIITIVISFFVFIVLYIRKILHDRNTEYINKINDLEKYIEIELKKRDVFDDIINGKLVRGLIYLYKKTGIKYPERKFISDEENILGQYIDEINQDRINKLNSLFANEHNRDHKQISD